MFAYTSTLPEARNDTPRNTDVHLHSGYTRGKHRALTIAIFLAQQLGIYVIQSDRSIIRLGVFDDQCPTVSRVCQCQRATRAKTRHLQCRAAVSMDFFLSATQRGGEEITPQGVGETDWPRSTKHTPHLGQRTDLHNFDSGEAEEASSRG